ncbi:alpha/beta hydrolase-fold protein [Actinoallomurus soli]|uniref:alpha/beta hydrolase-fold protein n=1 Tax=Actinoallomurus soli TaxID=2952535 RepID=UPI0020937FD9|nr:alpha/beta hydrolase-fold protein [Actinoallomurus soli]MCO5971402.1 esterase family protein [Actinoallomurus soli]
MTADVRRRSGYTVVTIEHESALLAGNPLGDPHRREILVLAPREPSERPLPVVYLLSGYGSRGRGLLADHVLGDGLTGIVGGLVDAGRLPPSYVVLPDCTTRYGGSQYLDSPMCGPYQRYLLDEIVPAVDERFPTVRAARGRAVMGKSSGGYGAVMAAALRPGVFGHVIAHTPDAGFEHCYLSLLPRVLDTLRERGGIGTLTGPGYEGPFDAAFMVAMSLVAMGVCYAPEGVSDPAAAFVCDPDTGRFRDDVWSAWLSHDPVRLAARRAPALRELGSFFLDVGSRDEYGMRWGVRALDAALTDAGVPHTFEEHGGGHHGIEHRFARSLSLLGRHWSASCAE